MNKFKNTVIFIAGTTIGFTTGVVVIVNTALKSETLRKSIINAISSKVSDLVYGEILNSSGGNDKSKDSTCRTSYQRYYNEYRCHSVYDDILFETRTDGEKVIDSLQNLLNEYGCVSVADLYDLVSLTSTYQDNLVGWTTLDTVNLSRTRAGYLLKLPKPVRFN